MTSVRKDDYQVIDGLIETHLFNGLSDFMKIETYRTDSSDEGEKREDEKRVVARLGEIQKLLNDQTAEFNKGQTTKLRSFEWKKKITEKGKETEYWLFGLRLGTGDYKITVCSHLDTVPPGDKSAWDHPPFDLKIERRKYPDEGNQDFYIGRGSVDDKGPAIVAFNVLKAVAKLYDGSSKLDNVTVELLFDTSEETGMSMPYYLKDEETKPPDLGVIYDGVWTIRAEKGIERPVFKIDRGTRVSEGIWVDGLNTPKGPSNQIPGSATATIRSDSLERLNEFKDNVKKWYKDCTFDDKKYRPARLSIELNKKGNVLTLVTVVKGAQHGSAPNENREDGANPLVSLANFLGALVGEGKLASNAVGAMCQFISWAWGTKVYGEHHPELLDRYDEVFVKKNGTTYAVTRMYTNPKSVQLEIDIRYAIGHHSNPWYGVEGLLKGKNSIFADVFKQLTGEFNRKYHTHQVTIKTETAAAPDIRLPKGKSFSKIAAAYEQVMKEPTQALAIGGGTDAKGNNNLIAAGALFKNLLGPPVNFHGFNEGVPVKDLKNGARIIYRLFVDEIEAHQ